MYSRELEGEVYQFGVSGMLYKNALVMYDLETDSLWLHFTGESVAGKLKGKSLAHIAAAPVVTWSQWISEYPETKVLKVGEQTHRARSTYEEYNSNAEQAGVIARNNSDDRLESKEIVLGIKIGDAMRAYPLRSMREGGQVINDTLGGKEIVVFAVKDEGLLGAFIRPTGVTFTSIEELELVASDGDRFHALSDSRLTRIPVTRSFWFGWVDHYPDTEVYENGQD